MEANPSSGAVVYLPGFDRGTLEPSGDGGVPTLWSVYEYRYKGAVWGLGEAHLVGAMPEPLTLLDWLQSHGVQLATKKARGELYTPHFGFVSDYRAEVLRGLRRTSYVDVPERPSAASSRPKAKVSEASMSSGPVTCRVET